MTDREKAKKLGGLMGDLFLAAQDKLDELQEKIDRETKESV